MINIGTLVGFLQLRDEFSGPMLNVTRNLTSTANTLDGLSSKFSRTGQSLLPLSGSLLAAGGASTVMAASFESAMTRLVSTAGVAQDEIGGVTEHILALAPAAGIGPQELADAMMKVSSTVSETSVALDILDIAAKGAKAGFGETVSVAGALTTVINSYGSANITAAHAGDVLAMAIKEGGAEAKELAPTLANVVPFAATLGVSFEEVAANIATFTKLGVPTAEAVTSLTAVFTALSKETKEGTEALAKMGMSYDSLRAAVKEKGLAAAMTDLTERFGGNVTAMTDVFGRVEAVKNIMGTAGVQGETYAAVLAKITASSDTAGGALQGMADAMSGKTAQTWSELTALAQTLAIRIGDILAPALGRMMQAAAPVLTWVADAIRWFAQLPTPVQTTAIALLAVAAAAAPTLLALASFAQVASVAAGGLVPLVTATTGAVSVFGFWTAALNGTTSSVFLARAAVGYYTVEIAANNLVATASAAAQRLLGAAILALNINLNVLMASLATTRVGQLAVSAATAVSTAAMSAGALAAKAFGVAIGILTYAVLPLVVLWGTYKAAAAALDWAGWTDKVARFTLRLQGLSQAQAAAAVESHNMARRAAEGATGFDAQAEAAKRLRDEISGARLANDVEKLRVAFASLTDEQRVSPDVMKRVGEQAQMLREQGGQLHPELRAAADAFVKLRDAAAGVVPPLRVLTEEQQKLLDQYSGAGLLTEAQNYELVLTRIGGASKLTRDETEAFVKAFDAVIAKYRLLGPAGEKVVAHYTALADSARDWTRVHEQNLAIQVANEAKAWRDKAAMLDFNGTRALQEAERQFAAWQDATKRNLQLNLDAHREAALRKAALLDQAGLNELKRTEEHYQRVTKFSKAALQQIANEAWKDYAEVTAASGQFSAAAVRHFKEVAEAAQAAADGGIGGLRGAIATVSDVLDESAKAWHRLADVTDSAMARSMAAVTSGAAIIAKDIKGILEAKDAFGAVIAVINLAVDAVGLLWDAMTRSPGEDVMRRVANAWGVSIGEALGDQIAETAKARFRNNRGAAEVFHMRDLIQVAGGLDDSNITRFLARLRDTFVHLQTGVFQASDAIEVLDENFGAFAEQATRHGRLVSDQFLEIIRLSDAAGLRVEAINAYVTGQVRGAIDGLHTLITQSTITTQTTANGLTAALGASFDELLRRGMSASEAIELMGPTIDALEEQLQASGLTGGAAFEQLRAMSTLAADEIAGPLLDAIHGGAQAITGLHNGGILTQEMFAGLSGQVTETFRSLVAQGYDGAAAMVLVGRDIQRIWEAQQDFGFEVDDATQLLIDQAIEAGRVGDAHRDAQERAVLAMQNAADAMERVGDTLERVFGTAADEGESFAARVRHAIDGIPRDIEIRVHGSIPNFADPNAVGDIEPLPGFAGGTRGRLIDFGRGTDVTLHGRERVQTEAEVRLESQRVGDLRGVESRLDRLETSLLAVVRHELPNALRHVVQTSGGRRR